MKIRTVKIWLSKGWYYAVYSVSLLLIPLITSCSSSRSTIKNKTITGENVADNNSVEGVNSDSLNIYSKLSIPSRSDFQDSVLFNGVMVALEDILKDGTAIYGPPLVEDKYNNLPLKIKEPDMRLMYGVQPPENPRNATPLVVLDHNIAGIDKERLIQFDFASGSSSKEQVATLLGVKSKKLMAYKILTGTDATSVWGMRAYYGILDVLSKKAYRKALKSGKSLDDYQLYK